MHTDTRHTYNEVLFLCIILIPGGPRRPLWRLWFYLLYMNPPRILESIREIARCIRTSMVVQREILCHGYFDKFSLRLFFSLPFYVPVCNSRVISSPFIVALPRTEKRINKITRRWASEFLSSIMRHLSRTQESRDGIHPNYASMRFYSNFFYDARSQSNAFNIKIYNLYLYCDR